MATLTRFSTATARAAVALAVVTTLSCTTTTDPSSSNAAQRPAPTVTWGDCEVDLPGSDADCGTVSVPLDYDDPGGASMEVALVRIPATNPEDRIGSLLINPGGPGGSGIDFALGSYWNPEITKHFDIVGFDPRGVGQSSPLECNDTLEVIYSVNPAPRTAQATAELLDVSEAFVDACAEKYEAVLPHLGTRNVAHDMDSIRVALGEDKINYVGYSYGTSIGQVYADLYPTRIRAMVLDGVVKLGQPGLDAAIAQGNGFETTLDRFFEACSRNTNCAIHDDPEGTFDAVRARLETDPLRAYPDRPLTPGLFQVGVAQALYADSLWPNLQNGLSEASSDDPHGKTILSLADTYLGRMGDTYDHGFEIYFAVSCLDWDWPEDPEAYLTAGREAAEEAPRMGEAIVTDYVRCAYWPTPPQPLTPPEAIGAPPIVVVSTTEDAATPYANGVELAELLPEAALISKEGTTHTAYGQGDSCVDGPIDKYLVSLVVPKDTTC